ncbi:MAG: hypothetical protein ACLQER_06965 [Streptosporangiaceae bacterium]
MTPAPQESRRDVTGVIYLLHFDRPIGNTRSKTGYAQHYTGWASNLVTRLAQHMSRSDAKIVQAFRQAGIGWELARPGPAPAPGSARSRLRAAPPGTAPSARASHRRSPLRRLRPVTA